MFFPDIFGTFARQMKFLIASIFLFLFLFSMKAQPVVDLGPDIIACDSAILDAGNPGASYLWSTGDTTQAITVFQSDTFWVDVTDVNGTTRDSVGVEIIITPNVPIVSDTTLCGGNVEIQAQSNADLVFWYADSLGTDFLGSGNSLFLNLLDTTKLFLRAFNTGTDTLLTHTGPKNRNNQISNGLKFDVFSPVIIEEVVLFSTVNSTADVLVENSAGDTLYLKTVNLQAVSGQTPNPVPLNLFLPVGVDYVIKLLNPTGNVVWSNQNVSYPYTIDGLISIKEDQNGSTNGYWFFFDWKLRYPGCGSDFESLNVNVTPTPVVSLGSDTIVCGDSLLLDATFSGATNYIWSTGDTSATIYAKSNGSFWAEVSQGICASRDSIQIELIPEAVLPVLSDTNVCGAGIIDFSLISSAQNILWFSDSSSLDIIAIGDSVELDVQATDTFYVEAVNVSADSIISHPGSLNRNDPIERGLKFDVFQDLVLNSVTVSVDQPTTADLLLLNPSGDTILWKPLDLFGQSLQTPNEIPLFLELTPGNGYIIAIRNPSGPIRWSNQQVAYPYTLDGLISIVSDDNNSTGGLWFFHIWNISKLSCRSGRSFFKVEVLAAPDVELGRDSFSCAPTVNLDAGNNPGATYTWSTGEQTQSITTDSSGLYKVQAAIGNCVTEDSISLELFPPANDPGSQNIQICGPQELALEVNPKAEVSLWYQTDTSQNFFFAGDTLVNNISDTTEFYIENLSWSSDAVFTFNSQLNRADPVANGATFDIHFPIFLESVTVVSDGAISTRVIVLSPGGDTLRDETLPLTFGGIPTPNEIPIYLDLEPGIGYKLIALDPVGGSLRWSNQGVSYPYHFEDFFTITSDANGASGGFWFFVEWKFRYGVCKSNRVPVVISPTFPKQLQDSTYACTGPVLLDATQPISTTYLWNTGETSSSISVDSSGNYSVLLDDGAGCVAKDSIFLEFPKPVGLPDDGPLCGTELSTNYGPEAQFLWSTNDTTPTISPGVAGIYSVIITEPRGCVLFDTVNITSFATFPVVDLGPDQQGCDSVLLDAGNPGLSFVWSNGDTTQSTWVFSSGSYSVTVTNPEGCATSDQVNVFVAQKPPAAFFQPDTIISPNLIVNFVNQSGFGNYLWNFGDGNTSTQTNPIHTYGDTGTYCVTLRVDDVVNNCGSDTAIQCFLLLRDDPVGLNSNVFPESVSLYPVPSHEHLVLEGDPSFINSIQSSYFLDATGKRVVSEAKWETNRLIFNLETYSPGIYLLILQVEGRLYTQRVQKVSD